MRDKQRRDDIIYWAITLIIGLWTLAELYRCQSLLTSALPSLASTLPCLARCF